MEFLNNYEIEQLIRNEINDEAADAFHNWVEQIRGEYNPEGYYDGFVLGEDSLGTVTS